MTDRSLALYSNFFKAISNPARLQIILLLEQGELCVCDIESELNLDMSVISRHLKQLYGNQIVSSTRHGKKVFYKLEMPCILSFINCIGTELAAEK